jgi:hypothetical protein
MRTSPCATGDSGQSSIKCASLARFHKPIFYRVKLKLLLFAIPKRVSRHQQQFKQLLKLAQFNASAVTSTCAIGIIGLLYTKNAT